jgi:hypothetical protein
MLFLVEFRFCCSIAYWVCPVTVRKHSCKVVWSCFAWQPVGGMCGQRHFMLQVALLCACWLCKQLRALALSVARGTNSA